MNPRDRATIIHLLDSAAGRIEGLRNGQTEGTTAAAVAMSVEDLIVVLRLIVEAGEPGPPTGGGFA